MSEQGKQSQELIKEIQQKAESLKRDNPAEYKRMLQELEIALKTYNQELQSIISE